jgi:hypothetical protein
MSRSLLTSVTGCALLLLAAASPAPAVTLSVVPARPVEQTPFTLVVGGTASCPSLESLKIVQQTIVVKLLLNPCPTLPQPFLLEVPVPPLAQGEWMFQVIGDERVAAWHSVKVEPVPFELDFVPPTPQPGSPFSVLLRGSGSCPHFGADLNDLQDGNLFTLRFVDSCSIEIVHGPAPFVSEIEMKPLAAGDYVVQAIDLAGRTLASRRLHISDAGECQPSETALCLLQGRYRVEATWRTATAQGVARAHPEAANYGAFSLSDPEHLELFAGVRDACATEFQMVWVYTAGLTDAETELTVTEVATGEVRRYPNPLGMPFVPMLDPMAFVCQQQVP